MGSDDERATCVRYANRIRSYGLCHLRDGTAADELVQQVLLVVIEALRGGHVKDRANLDSYVFGTCRNMVFDMRRGNARQRRIAEQAAAASLPEGYEPPMAVLDRSRLDSCLEKLDGRARAIVLATFVDERDANEVGRSMELSPGNVRVIRHRALGQLQDCMEGGARA